MPGFHVMTLLETSVIFKGWDLLEKSYALGNMHLEGILVPQPRLIHASWMAGWTALLYYKILAVNYRHRLQNNEEIGRDFQKDGTKLHIILFNLIILILWHSQEADSSLVNCLNLFLFKRSMFSPLRGAVKWRRNEYEGTITSFRMFMSFYLSENFYHRLTTNDWWVSLLPSVESQFLETTQTEDGAGSIGVVSVHLPGVLKTLGSITGVSKESKNE